MKRPVVLLAVLAGGLLSGALLSGGRALAEDPAARSAAGQVRPLARTATAPKLALLSAQPPPRRIVALGDLHGDLAATRRALVNPFGPVWPDSPRPVGGFQVHALDAAGKQLTAAYAQSTDIGDDGMTMTQQFQLTCRPDRGGAPVKLVVIGPRSVTVEVPFRLENVPLP